MLLPKDGEASGPWVMLCALCLQLVFKLVTLGEIVPKMYVKSA